MCIILSDKHFLSKKVSGVLTFEVEFATFEHYNYVCKSQNSAKHEKSIEQKKMKGKEEEEEDEERREEEKEDEEDGDLFSEKSNSGCFYKIIVSKSNINRKGKRRSGYKSTPIPNKRWTRLKF